MLHVTDLGRREEASGRRCSRVESFTARGGDGTRDRPRQLKVWPPLLFLAWPPGVGNPGDLEGGTFKSRVVPGAPLRGGRAPSIPSAGVQACPGSAWGPVGEILG